MLMNIVIANTGSDTLFPKVTEFSQYGVDIIICVHNVCLPSEQHSDCLAFLPLSCFVRFPIYNNCFINLVHFTGERLKKSGEDLAQVVSAATPERTTEEEDDD